MPKISTEFNAPSVLARIRTKGLKTKISHTNQAAATPRSISSAWLFQLSQSQIHVNSSKKQTSNSLKPLENLESSTNISKKTAEFTGIEP